MLTVGSTAYTGKAVAFNDSLESFTFGSTDNVHILDAFENVSDGEDIT